ncbi:hypothetical protein QFC24_000858 [Naganishia onofrii]|uniref:Uncharacterized protein n=1 Tax=Naganishia onofrii TaxID=1851511 RepID=A0ACC2XTT0_9TREE|nr:hypothetical protein QFC24_000858 [Naganishia onofrii]
MSIMPPPKLVLLDTYTLETAISKLASLSIDTDILSNVAGTGEVLSLSQHSTFSNATQTQSATRSASNVSQTTVNPSSAQGPSVGTMQSVLSKIAEVGKLDYTPPWKSLRHCCLVDAHNFVYFDVTAEELPATKARRSAKYNSLDALQILINCIVLNCDNSQLAHVDEGTRYQLKGYLEKGNTSYLEPFRQIKIRDARDFRLRLQPIFVTILLQMQGYWIHNKERYDNLRKGYHGASSKVSARASAEGIGASFEALIKLPDDPAQGGVIASCISRLGHVLQDFKRRHEQSGDGNRDNPPVSKAVSETDSRPTVDRPNAVLSIDRERSESAAGKRQRGYSSSRSASELSDPPAKFATNSEDGGEEGLGAYNDEHAAENEKVNLEQALLYIPVPPIWEFGVKPGEGGMRQGETRKKEKNSLCFPKETTQARWLPVYIAHLEKKVGELDLAPGSEEQRDWVKAVLKEFRQRLPQAEKAHAEWWENRAKRRGERKARKRVMQLGGSS